MLLNNIVHNYLKSSTGSEPSKFDNCRKDFCIPLPAYGCYRKMSRKSQRNDNQINMLHNIQKN